jgi:hemoglobin
VSLCATKPPQSWVTFAERGLKGHLQSASLSAMTTTTETPILYEWAGGQAAFERLTEAFYARVRADDTLAPVFAHMPADHPHHVALWFAEVFGGPPRYTKELGGYPQMMRKHLGLALSEQQRARWVQLIGLAADDAELPADPEFRSAFLAYVEWGTRIALGNSQPGADPPPEAPVPRWGWGEAPPYGPPPPAREAGRG